MTREVREGMQAVRQAQGQHGETLLRLDQAAQPLLLTTDYLAALAEDNEADGEDEDEEDDDEDDEQDDVDGGVEGSDAAEAGDRVAEAADQLAAAEAADAAADTADWQAAFARIEEAWLEGRTVGDLHERLNFLHLVVDVRMETLEPAAIVAAFDRFRARAGGERFSYCPLHGAVHLVRARKPALDNPLVLVRYRELLRLPPCVGVESCPGIAASVSELLSRGR